MSTTPTCSCGKKHQGHICVLKSKGLLRDVEHISRNPTVVCFICGAEADASEHVCEPMALDK